MSVYTKFGAKVRYYLLFLDNIIYKSRRKKLNLQLITAKKMPKETFSFRLFTLRQDRCAMKVGTDSVLLGAWASIIEAKHILDIGTGTGILALFMAQRCPSAQITALEIDPQATSQARENIESSPWGDRIITICEDFCQFTSPPLFDQIISNPPYFKDSLPSPDHARNCARHTSTLSYNELIEKAASLLSPDGILSLVLPYEYAAEVRSIAFNYGLYTFRLAEIQPLPNGTVKRMMMEFSFHLQLCHTQRLILQTENGEYTPEIRHLTQDFYLP